MVVIIVCITYFKITKYVNCLLHRTKVTQTAQLSPTPVSIIFCTLGSISVYGLVGIFVINISTKF